MAVYLDYQAVYCDRRTITISTRVQVLLLLLVFSIFAVKVWLQLEATRLGYLLSKERQLTVQMDMERRELELHKSVLLRPENLAVQAKGKLGLSHWDSSKVLRVVY